MSPAASSRWCPTPEQLMILEQMYRGGLRAPNAGQIQQITARLSLYGKIEGKNVFYWFQNHKARERQRLRRKMMMNSNQNINQQQKSCLDNLVFHNHLDSGHVVAAAAATFHQPFHYNSVGCLQYQGLVANDKSSRQGMDHKWTADLPELGYDVDSSMQRIYGPDWIMTREVGPTTNAAGAGGCDRRPLKTLELFPIKATTLNHRSAASTTTNPP